MDSLSDKILICNDKNWTDVIPTEDVKQFIKDREDDIEEEVIIKVDDIPEYMAGIDLTWLGREIGKIKNRLIRSLRKRAGNKLIEEKQKNEKSKKN